MHLVIPVTIATAMAADVMRQRCFSVRRGPKRQIASSRLPLGHTVDLEGGLTIFEPDEMELCTHLTLLSL